jgi:hypothetical protein
MPHALIYIVSRAFYRIGDFFKHWYIDSARVIAHKTLIVLESLDQSLALRVTIEHFFDPLYQDHSIIGHLLGFVFRSGRILLAVFIYAFVAAIALLSYAAWAGILTYTLYRIIIFFPTS